MVTGRRPKGGGDSTAAKWIRSGIDHRLRPFQSPGTNRNYHSSALPLAPYFPRQPHILSPRAPRVDFQSSTSHCLNTECSHHLPANCSPPQVQTPPCHRKPRGCAFPSCVETPFSSRGHGVKSKVSGKLHGQCVMTRSMQGSFGRRLTMSMLTYGG